MIWALVIFLIFFLSNLKDWTFCFSYAAAMYVVFAGKMSSSNIIMFEDIFVVDKLDPDGKKFDKGIYDFNSPLILFL